MGSRLGCPNVTTLERRSWWEAQVALDAADCILPYWTTSLYPRLGQEALHVIACERANGPRPTGQVVRHLACGDARCVNPLHLAWGSQAENIEDNRTHGVLRRGRQINTAKVTEEQVLVIRSRYEAGETAAAIARDYPIEWRAAWAIGTRRSWSWL